MGQYWWVSLEGGRSNQTPRSNSAASYEGFHYTDSKHLWYAHARICHHVSRKKPRLYETENKLPVIQWFLSCLFFKVHLPKIPSIQCIFINLEREINTSFMQKTCIVNNYSRSAPHKCTVNTSRYKMVDFDFYQWMNLQQLCY